MQKEMNKKAQNLTIGTLVLIVLGVVVAVVLIIGFTQGFAFITDVFKRGPSEIQLKAEACQAFAQGNLKIDFCSFEELEDSNEWVNCLDNRILNDIGQDIVDKNVYCENFPSAKKFCVEENLKVDDMVNNRRCDFWTSTDQTLENE